MNRLLPLLLVACGACGSYSNYKTTRIVPAGKTEFVTGLQVSGAGTQGAIGGDAALPLPEFAFDIRRAIVPERVELQVNTTFLALKPASTGSIELGGKVRLVEHGRWSLATGAAAGYRIADAGGAIIEGAYGSVPVIGGVELGRHQLVLSVTGGFQRWYASGARPVNVPFVGESLGFLWQVGKTWALLPEVGTAWTPTPNFMSSETKLFEVGIAAVFSR